MVDAAGNGIPAVQVTSSPTHFALTDAAGRYELPGLIDSARRVTPLKAGLQLTPQERPVTLSGADVCDVDFRGQ